MKETMKQAAIALFLLTTSCSKPSEVTCGAGTVLKDGVCVVESKEQGAARGMQSDAAAKPGENVKQAAADEPLNKPAADATAGTANGQQWVFTTEHDAMRNKDVHFARLLSTNTVEFDFPYAGGSRLGLVLRKGDPGSGFGLDVLAVIEKGQFDCGNDGCSVSIKFDDVEVERWSMSPPASANARTLFFNRASQLASKLKTAKKIIVEASFFSEGRRQFAFAVPPLDWPALPDTGKGDKKSGNSAPKVEVFCVKSTKQTQCFTGLKDCEMEALGLIDSSGADAHCTVWSKPACKPAADGSCSVSNTDN